MSLRALGLFSGIGAYELGAQRAGMRIVGLVEKNEFCRAVLRRHFKDVPIHDDVTTREYVRGEADVILGGFPCQDISYAGKRAGLAGARSGLFWEMVRAIRVVRPGSVIVENVAAILDGGLGVVLGTMAADGYDAEWDSISLDELGAPHGRPRVFIALTDAYSEQWASRSYSPVRWWERRAQEGAQASTDADSHRKLQPPRLLGYFRRWVADGSARTLWADHWQAKFEAFRGMDDGAPTRLDRSRESAAIAALGNCNPPIIIETIARAILATHPHQEQADG